MANGNYNHIYTELVQDENDILGVLAYSLYKRQKIEYIRALKQKTGNEPMDVELVPFHDFSNSPSQLESYRNQASQLANNFLEISLQTQAEQVERYYDAKASAEIRNARPGFWLGVGQSVIGSAAFVLLLGFLVFFTWSLNQGPRQVVEHIFNVKIVSKDASGTANTLDLPLPP